VLGREPAAGVLLGVTDSSWLSLTGIPALPALGCGSLAVAHQPNERIPEPDLGLAIDLTEALARAYADDALAGSLGGDASPAQLPSRVEEGIKETEPRARCR
jgi:hypothetical protein